MSSLRSLSSTTYASRTNTTVTAPSGIQNDDILTLAFYLFSTSSTPPSITLPSGFNARSGYPHLITPDVPSEFVHVWLADKVAASESGDYQITHSSFTTEGLILCVQDADTEAAVIGTWNSGFGTTTTALSVTPNLDNSLVAFLSSNWQLFGSSSPPTGTTPTFTEQLDSASSIVYVATGVLDTAGATGNKSHSNNNTASGGWSGILLAWDNFVDTRQSLRPDGVEDAASWTANSGTLATATADEDDGTYGTSNTAPSNSECILTLGNPAGTPAAGTYTLNYRAQKVTGTQQINLTMGVYEAGNLVEAFTETNLSGTLTAYSHNLTSPSITDHNALKVRPKAHQVDATVTPIIEAGDATVTTIGTAADPWAINRPVCSTGDGVIFIIAWDDSTDVTSVAAPSGPNGETISSIVGPQASFSTEMRIQAWQTKATGAWSSGTLSFNPSASETCRAVAIRVPAGEFDSTTFIGASAGRSSAAANESNVNSPEFSAGATDGDGRLVLCFGSDTDAITVPASGTDTVNNATGGGVGLCVETRTAEVTDSENIAAITATITSDSWATIAFVVRAPVLTDAAARVMRTELLVPAASGAVSVTLAGNAGTGAAGTTTTQTGATITLASTAGTGAAGTVTASTVTNASTTLAGVTATGAADDVSLSTGQTLTLASVAATGAAGIATGTTPDVTLTINGVSATGAVNAPTITGGALSILTGTAGTGAAGNVSVDIGMTVTLAGVAATGALGDPTLICAASFTLPGVSGTAGLGTVTAISPDSVTLVNGVASTGAAGLPSLVTSAIFALSGTAATGAAGTVTASATGDAVAVLSGVGATSAAGTLSLTCDAAFSAVGAGATSAAGLFAISAGATVIPAGVSAIASLGTLIATSQLVGIILAANQLHSRTTCSRPAIEPPAQPATSRTVTTRPRVTVNP